jgi:hypothetical protein
VVFSKIFRQGRFDKIDVGAGTPATAIDRGIRQAGGDSIDLDGGQFPDQGPAQEIRFPVVKPLLGGPAAAFVMVLNLGRDAAPVGRPV